MQRVEYVTKVGTLATAFIHFPQFVKLATFPHLRQIEDGGSDVMYMAPSDSARMIDNKEVTEGLAVPSAPLF